MTRGTVRRWLTPVLLPMILIGGAVFGTARIERSSAVDSANSEQEAQQLLTAMLDQETGARGYFVTRDQAFLQPWYQGTREFSLAFAAAHTDDAGDQVLLRDLETQARISRDWHRLAAVEIMSFRRTGRPVTVKAALVRKALMDSFRRANASFMGDLGRQRDAALAESSWLAVVLAGGLSLTLSILALLLLRRSRIREHRRRRQDAEFRALLQVSASEDESRLLLVRHLKRSAPGAGVAVLNRNNSDDRLEVTVSEEAQETPLRDLPHDQLRPRDCLAVRLSRSYERRVNEPSLAQCQLCGKLAADIACEPLLVGGQVIGAVLVAKEGHLKESERGYLRDTVVQAAPIIANQRNLSLAETRAATDALTALPNRRAADDTLKRMVAHASRSLSPVSALLIDLDHFKQINDVQGHEQGDEALAAVGAILDSALRGADFAARYGGEEFLVLLPDTAKEQARQVAEKLRVLIEQMDLRCGRVTASFGVASMPEDAGDSEALVRQADRALYAAKGRGRNRVEIAEVPPDPGGTELAESGALS